MSAGWNWVELGQELLRAAHLVHDAQLVEVLVVFLDGELGDDLEHVAGDAVLGRQAVHRDGRGLRRGPLHEGPDGGATVGARVLQLLRVAVVAVEGGHRRVRPQDVLPEAVGERVDAGRDGFGSVTEGLPNCVRIGRGAGAGRPGR